MSAKVKIFNDISECIYGDNTDSHANCTHRGARAPKESYHLLRDPSKLLKPL